MTDKFVDYSVGLDSPSVDAFVMTLDDTAIETTRALYIGGAGDVAVVMRDGGSVTFKNMSIGFHPIRVKEVKTIGTTATDILGLL